MKASAFSVLRLKVYATVPGTNYKIINAHGKRYGKQDDYLITVDDTEMTVNAP